MEETGLQGLQLFDASGRPIDDVQAALEAAAVSAQDTACLELRNGDLTFYIEVVFNDPNTYPLLILGGTISGDICGANPPWLITGGSMGPSLRIEPVRRAPACCATGVTVLGEFQPPAIYRGTYVFTYPPPIVGRQWPHTTLFRNWGPCPRT
jgi:hypothetical protein